MLRWLMLLRHVDRTFGKITLVAFPIAGVAERAGRLPSWAAE